ncbi:TPA: response regulator transcription factor [Pseudomonas aeruginosa]|nr:response regulator transcription factor [Pseudomonas aeruginosa]
MKQLRIAILDDHAVVRHGLVSHLAAEPGINLAGVYGKSHELLQGMLIAPADILLLDFSLGRDELDGASLIRTVRVKFPDCHILVLSAHHGPAIVSLALRVGARGFVGKGEDIDCLVKAIRTIASGLIYLSADMSYQIAGAIRSPAPNQTSSNVSILECASLSAREQEVIRCYLAGMTVTEIAKKFSRSIKTISTQKAAAFRKLGVSSDNSLFKIMQALE